MKTGTVLKFNPPKEALDALAEEDGQIDAVLANPKFGELPDGVKLTPPAERHMSIPEASGILMELARKRSMSIDQVNALEMAVRRLMRQHFQRQRNWAKRRERQQADDSKAAEPLSPEEGLADTVARELKG